ncbi:HWE histidine kinase domain-containing protein (plasmid) [Rhizobium sp. CB3090]|uniref:sensor histidine kinase n=1 Tax=Rhizobium sp. CB3090 TaxID=3039156 RepID=UPI0024B0A587|nr:HWE histidine kinase domain-containing protein [Rhizobium sp. CB3090]WFU12069.1 HWE histidine kinase domain-containing protein [Rhizobium sp. CB3090]
MMLEDLYRLLRSSHVQAQGVVDTMTQPVVVLDQGFCVATANNAFIRTFKVERDDILGRSFFDLGNGQWDIEELRQLIALVIPKASAVIGFEVTHDFPVIGRRTFLVDARRLIHPDDNSTNILVLFDDVTERQRHEAEQNFIISESRHRMKNLFAVVRAIAMQTGTEDRTANEYRDAFLGRVEVALRAQEFVSNKGTADLAALLKNSVGETGMDRIHFDGPTVQLSSSKVLPVSMIIHELATNAVKYGALSVPEGEIHMKWSLETGPKDRTYLKYEWREENGPAVRAPMRKGYGTELIEGSAAHLGGEAELIYGATGLRATIKLPM